MMVASKRLGMAVLPRLPRTRTLVVVVGIPVPLWAVIVLARLYTDLLWFREVGKARVFWGVIGARLVLTAVAAAATGAFVAANLWRAERLARRSRQRGTEWPEPTGRAGLLAQHLLPLSVGAVAVLALGSGLHAASHWQTLLLWRNRVAFGDSDAQFHRDIGYYVFTLPLQRLVFGWLLFTLLAGLVAAGAAYYLLGGIRTGPAGRRVAPEARAHLSIPVALVLLLKAWGYRLDQFPLLLSPRRGVAGAPDTDVHPQ